MKPWLKATSEGKLYVDTSHPEWKKWFIEQIKKYSKINIMQKQVNCLEKNPAVEKHYASMSNEQKLAEIDDSLKSAVKIVRNLEKQKAKVMIEMMKR